MPDAWCHSTRKRFMARIASGRSMSPRRQARSHGRRADVRTHRRDRIRLARQDVALFEAALGGQIQVAATVGADRARFLTLDVALQPGGIDRLNQEFLVGIDGQGISPRGAGCARLPPRSDRTIALSCRHGRRDRRYRVGPPTGPVDAGRPRGLGWPRDGDLPPACPPARHRLLPRVPVARPAPRSIASALRPNDWPRPPAPG